MRSHSGRNTLSAATVEFSSDTNAAAPRRGFLLDSSDIGGKLETTSRNSKYICACAAVVRPPNHRTPANAPPIVVAATAAIRGGGAGLSRATIASGPNEWAGGVAERHWTEAVCGGGFAVGLNEAVGWRSGHGARGTPRRRPAAAVVEEIWGDHDVGRGSGASVAQACPHKFDGGRARRPMKNLMQSSLVQ